MRDLILMRGAPGSGKSTFLKNNNLEQYTISADSIRLLFESPVMMHDAGKIGISQKHNDKVWKFLFEVLEDRMERGEFTIIDACHSKTSEFTRYVNLAEKYRYRLHCIDFSDVDINVCKSQNMSRPTYKHVPEYVIDNIYERFAFNKIPSRVNIIDKNHIQDFLKFDSIDVSNYNKVVFFGDIHGCFTPLNEYFQKNEFDDNSLYVFLGDYFDRGIQNKEMCDWLLANYMKKNVMLLQGNHEKWLMEYANNMYTDDYVCRSKEFANYTLKQLESFDKKELRQLCRKFIQCAYLKFHENEFICTHAGIGFMPENLKLISTFEMIRGGKYEEPIDEYFEMNNKNDHLFQVHGHRNIFNIEANKFSHSFNLNDEIEFGKNLRILEVSKNGFNFLNIKNNVYDEIRFNKNAVYTSNEVNQNIEASSLVSSLRNSKDIYEKTSGSISSFNFKKDVFFSGKWSDLSKVARGLFINTGITNDIVARGYEKFFNYKEKQFNQPSWLNENLKFPVTVYKKYNGFLGLLGYDKANTDGNKLVFCSKSSIDSEFAGWFKEIFMNNISGNKDEYILKLEQFLNDNNYCLIFEVIDPDNDPHIIKYNEKKIILLAAIKRDINFNEASFDELIKIASEFNWSCKEVECKLNTFDDLMAFINNVIDDDKSKVEGFVIEDQNKYMFKLKCKYYKMWKNLRSYKDRIAKYGNAVKIGFAQDAIETKFIAWIRSKNPDFVIGNDIITLREKFYQEMN